MKSTWKTLFLNPDDWRIVWRTLVIAGILGLLGFISSFWKPEIGRTLLEWLTYQIRIDVPIYAVLVALFLLFLFSRKVVVSLSRPRHERKYVEDVFDGFRWRWTYNKGTLQDITPFCIKDGCDTECKADLKVELETDWSGPAKNGTDIYCNECNKMTRLVNVLDHKDHIRRKIEKKIRDGSWER